MKSERPDYLVIDDAEVRLTIWAASDAHPVLR